MARAIFSALFLMALISCEPQYPPPEGYVDSCYGGDFAKNIAGIKPELTITMEVGIEHWPRLKIELERLAARSNVDFFYDDRDYGGLTMFNASLCSPKGLYMNVDKRIWESQKASKLPKLPMMMTVYVYRDKDTWSTFLSNVESEIEKNWNNFLVDYEGDVSLQISY